MTERTEPDVVDLLLDQHARIRRLLVQVEEGPAAERTGRFRELRRLLAVHETAEEEVVHPQARLLPDGERIVAARLEEERAAKQVLASLDEIDPEDPAFAAGFAELRDAVLHHAEREEGEEFPRLRRDLDPDLRVGMATAVRAAEAIAPTRPHPGVETATANLLAGPVAAVVDRARDAIRSVRDRTG